MYPGADNVVASREISSPPALEGSERLPAAVEADLAEIKVLVVDDDTRNLYALKSMLEARKIEVLQAENGKVALELLQTHPDVDLVLMDTMMPELDGLAATSAIRDMLEFQRLPIISLTAKAMQGDREAALLAGATDYITKPVTPERLFPVLQRWLPSRSASSSQTRAEVRPRARERRKEKRATMTTADQGALSASVLIVDDTGANLVALAAVLRPLGVRIVGALSGRTRSPG